MKENPDPNTPAVAWQLVEKLRPKAKRSHVKLGWRQINIIYRNRFELEPLRAWVKQNEHQLQKMLARLENKTPVIVPQSVAAKSSMRAKAKSVLLPRVQHWANQYDLHPVKTSFRANTSRWGSCSSRGNLSLNMALTQLPSNLQDYVILHELAHLRHRNHSRHFWQFLESICPGSKALDKQLDHYILSLE